MRPEPGIGEVFAGYRIEDVAGRGGMGVVYRATELELERPIALKVIAVALAEDVNFRKRFIREQRTAARLDHPNVVPVYRAGEEQGLLFIAMRFVEGIDLRKLIAQEGPLDDRRAANIIAQVGDALDTAHAHGLVHRDVKPGNVLLTGTSEREHVYLSDFGLTAHTTSVGGITETGHWVGTLDYVSPEQIRGEQADARSDVYSLGAVLYQALTGSVPYPMRSDAAKLYAHLAGNPPKCSDHAGIPQEFDEVIARALAKDPDDRYPSAGDLGRAALAAAQRRPVAAPERSLARGAAAPAGPGEPPTPLPTSTPPEPRPTELATQPVADPARPQAAGVGRQAPTRPAGRVPIAAIVAAATAIVAAVVAAVVLTTSGGDNGAGVQEIAVGQRPGDVAVAGRTAWVAVPGQEQVARVDTATSRVTGRTHVPDGPFKVAADATGAWVATELSRRITHIGPSGRLTGPSASVHGDVYDLAAAGGHVWVTQQTGSGPLTKKPTVVSMIDAATGRSTAPELRVGKGPTDVAVGAGAVWAANAGSANVYRIDATTGRQIGPPAHAGSTATAIAAGPEGVWVVDGDSGVVNRLNPNGRGVVKTVKIGGRPADVAVGGGAVWVVDPSGGRLVQIDARSGDVKRRTEVGAQPSSVAVGSGAVWVTNSAASTLARIGL